MESEAHPQEAKCWEWQFEDTHFTHDWYGPITESAMNQIEALAKEAGLVIVKRLVKGWS